MTAQSPRAALLRWIALAVPLWSGAVFAQPADLPVAPATTDIYPPGVRVGGTPRAPVYASKGGLTLYGMDMRTLMRAGPDPAQYCKGACAEEWEPMLAPASAKPNIRFPRTYGSGDAPPGYFQPLKAPDWTIIDGAAGPQWVYKGWHLVFVRKGDRRGSTAFDGHDNRVWNTLKFVPPVPTIVAPKNVLPIFFEGAYALSDSNGRLLYTGDCEGGCADWMPFAGGLASSAIGAWRVDAEGDVPQWTYKRKPVFVAPSARIPSGGKALRP